LIGSRDCPKHIAHDQTVVINLAQGEPTERAV